MRQAGILEAEGSSAHAQPNLSCKEILDAPNLLQGLSSCCVGVVPAVAMLPGV